MSSSTTTAPVVIRKPQDVVDLVNTHPALKSGLPAVLVGLGGIMIDAYQAAMVGFGNKYIAQQFEVSQGLAATVNASVLVAALIGGLLSNRIIQTLGQRRAFVLGMSLCVIGAAAVAFAPSIWFVLICRIILGFGLGIDFPLATSAVAELRGSASKKSGTSVNLWQMGWYLSSTVVYLVLIILAAVAVQEPMLWRYGIFIGAILAVVVIILRWFVIGESAMWAARVGKMHLAAHILKDRYGVDAVVAEGAEGETETEYKVTGAYSVIVSKKYLPRTVLGCVVATCQAWQYNAVGIYLPLTLAGILAGGLSAALTGSLLVNLLFGVTGGAIGSLVVTRFGTRRQSMFGFIGVALCLIVLGLTTDISPWLSIALLGAIIFLHSSGPGGLGMTIATLSYPPTIRPAGVGFARAIMRMGAIAGLILWPMMWGTMGTTAFLWLAIVPAVGALTCILIRWEPLGANVDAEDADVLNLVKVEASK